MISRLSLLAHAPTPAQRAFRFPGDEPIEPIGPGVAERAATEIGRWDRAWRGPERRSTETAVALAIEAAPQEELRAWSMGVWTGRPVTEVAEQDPAAFAAWRTGPDAAPEDGESFRCLLARVGTWIDAHTPTDHQALVVADPSVIRAAVVHLLRAGHDAFWALDIEPFSLTVIQHANGTSRVRAVGIELRR